MPILIVLAAVLVAIIIWMAVSYNKLVELRSRIENQKAQIDVHLKRRAELIPNLIQTVKGCAKFEKSTLTELAELRCRIMNPESTVAALSADESLGRLCSKILAIGESYPELKANTNFIKMQEELSDTENKIAFARQFYNDIVAKYNTAVQVFPRSIAAGIFGFKKIALPEIQDNERETVKVDGDVFL